MLVCLQELLQPSYSPVLGCGTHSKKDKSGGAPWRAVSCPLYSEVNILPIGFSSQKQKPEETVIPD